ncbi:transmembrane protein [Cystoisospora suis]|uniref:Transmembrane protein n=1 Tax=Cystoisospora suis TaxID=483139 RepID=A0A2C6KHF1_9APIC|nr:transmembrane protein [Cystoisospora suis]
MHEGNMAPDGPERRASPPAAELSVSLPNPSLSQSSLLSGMPLLYHQSSLSTLLLATSARDSALSEGFSLSVPTQLVLPSGGIALGLPASPLTPSGRQTATGIGSGDATLSEDERVNRLRQGAVAVFASESPEEKVRSVRSRLLLLLTILVSLQLLSVFAVLQGKDSYSLFPSVRTRLRLAGALPASSFRYSFYVVVLVFCLALPVVVVLATELRRRELVAMAANPTPGGGPQPFVRLSPSVSVSACITVLSALCAVQALFVMSTYFDLLVFLLSLAIRAALNRLNYRCLAPHLLLIKPSNFPP